ncbi:MAG TPA: hypothetical protein EYQ83_17785 [Acidobacteria bacterium]|nr:hypothetical protein [Acidobacteriota bacterium]
MTQRKVLAAATLTAIPLFMGSMQTGVVPGTAETESAHTLQVEAQPAGPQWAYFWGMEGEEAAMFGAASAIGCAFFGPVGGMACGITGVA